MVGLRHPRGAVESRLPDLSGLHGRMDARQDQESERARERRGAAAMRMTRRARDMSGVVHTLHPICGTTCLEEDGEVERVEDPPTCLWCVAGKTFNIYTNSFTNPCAEISLDPR